MIYENIAHLMEGLLNGDKVRSPYWDQDVYFHLKCGKLVYGDGSECDLSLQGQFEQYVEPPPEQLYLWAYKDTSVLTPQEWIICNRLKTESEVKKDSNKIYRKISGPV